MSNPPLDAAAQAARRGALILSGAALLFSAMALCAKMASTRLPSPQVACIRFLIGLLAFAGPFALGRRLRPVKYGPLFLRGFFGGCSVLMYFLAIAHLPVGIATLLNSSWPVFVGLFSFLLLDEPLTIRALLALLCTSVGVLLVVLGSPSAAVLTQGQRAELWTTSRFLWGLIGLGSAVFSAAAVTTMRSMRQREGSWEIFIAFCLVGAVITGIPCALSWIRPTGIEMFWLLSMGLCSVVAQLGLTYALRDVRAITAGIILQLTPIATLLLGTAFFAERPTLLGWLGALVTLGGITWGILSR